jgi:hypothetical protein
LLFRPGRVRPGALCGRPRYVLGVLWRSWQAVTAMRRQDVRECQGRVTGPEEVGLSQGWADPRHGSAPERPHLARTRDEDAGNVTPPRVFCPSPGRYRAPETRCSPCGAYSDHKSCSALVTVGQHARKRGLPTVSVTACGFRHASVPLPCPARDDPSQSPVLPARDDPPHPAPDPARPGSEWPEPPHFPHPRPSRPRPQPARAVAGTAASLTRPTHPRAPPGNGRVPYPGTGFPAASLTPRAGRQRPRPFPGRQLATATAPHSARRPATAPTPCARHPKKPLAGARHSSSRPPSRVSL